MMQFLRTHARVRDALLAFGGIAGATLPFWLLRDLFGEGDLALAYLPVVALLAAFGGTRTGILAAVLALIAGKFFLLPTYYSLSIGDPKDWVSLVAFILVGLALGIQTQRMRRLERMAAQAEVLKEADRIKSVFISSVSHELRTPLSSVVATLTNLMETDVEWEPKTLREELSVAVEDLHHLDESIEALLDLSRLDSGAWKPHLDWCDLDEVIGSTLRRIGKSNRQRIEVNLPEQLPSLKVDYAQFMRALQNLLENALAYSPSESPVVLGAEEQPHELRVFVEDRGPGILPQERGRVFERFYRGQWSSARPTGTGLGLAVTRDIISLHGGRIWVEDGRAGGARFVIALPKDETRR